MAAVDEHGGEVGLRRRKTSNAAPGDKAQPAEVVARSSVDDDDEGDHAATPNWPNRRGTEILSQNGSTRYKYD